VAYLSFNLSNSKINNSDGMDGKIYHPFIGWFHTDDQCRGERGEAIDKDWLFSLLNYNVTRQLF
jgi:hypothetical protein